MKNGVFASLGEHGGIAPTTKKSEKVEARREKATPLPSHVSVLGGRAGRIDHSLHNFPIARIRDRVMCSISAASVILVPFFRT